MKKKTVLFLTESSWLATGYANHCRGLLEGLHATDKYDLYEMGCYGAHDDPRANALPWFYVPVRPDPTSEEENRLYRSTPLNEFGKWRFEEACLKIRPDVVLTVRDPWMDDFVWKSPLRRHYRWIHCPTVDAVPQDGDWLALYQNADRLLTYTDWGAEVVRSVGLEVWGAAPTGVDLDLFRPVVDPRAHKASLGMRPDDLVVMMASRNQVRKLFPDLIDAFVLLLGQAPPDVASRLVLYLHTTWPDTWDLPRLVTEAGIGDKCYFTYICRSCGEFRPFRFRGTRPNCPRCGGADMALPNTHWGVSREGLARLYNLADAYVQYSSCEGLGITQMEAAACGVPVFSVDYSAMSDVVRKVNGFPVKCLKLRRDPETCRRLAVPDDADLAARLLEFLSMPEAVRRARGGAARAGAGTHYQWADAVATWEGAIDSLVPALSWGAPPNLVPPPPTEPPGLSDADFVRWGIVEVAGRRDLVDTLIAARLVEGLSRGTAMRGHDRGALTRELAAMAAATNYWERRRTS